MEVQQREIDSMMGETKKFRSSRCLTLVANCCKTQELGCWKVEKVRGYKADLGRGMQQ